MGVAHLALDLGTGRECSHGVDHHHIECTGAHEHVGDLERLLAGVGLRDQQLVDVDTDGLGVDRIHRVLCIDVGADAAVALRLGHDVHGECGLPGRLRAIDLDDPAPGQAAHPQCEVECERAGGDRLDVHLALVAHLHDRALAVLLLDLTQSHLEGLVSLHRGLLCCFAVSGVRMLGCGRCRAAETQRRGLDHLPRGV